MTGRKEHLAVGLLLLAVIVPRVIRLDQPIVENYVGRQVPTAMVARNLERGSGLLAPQLDTGPFPSLFLIEPPIYGWLVVALRRATGLGLEPAGRLVSAVGVGLAVWGLYGLTGRRLGRRTALLASLALAMLPLTIRYGRAFQPDALAFGALLAGLRGWDDFENERGRRRWLALGVGVLMLALGLALKVIFAYILAPLVLVIQRRRTAGRALLVVLALLPAVLWYGHALAAVSQGGGSRAAAENFGIWLETLVPAGSIDLGTLRLVGRFLVVRSFTPIGFVGGLLGLWAVGTGRWRVVGERIRRSEPGGHGSPSGPDGGRLWLVWLAAALAFLAVVAEKMHHEYYLLALAPLIAVGLGATCAGLIARGRSGRLAALVLGSGFVGMSLVGTASTYRTPDEWRDVSAAARLVREALPRGVLVVAPEALLYAADRRGCRLEFDAASARRAAAEWGGRLDDASRVVGETSAALRLVAFYRRQGARYVADLGAAAGGPARCALHAELRRRYDIVVDRPEVFIARLDRPVVAGSLPRCPPRITRDLSPRPTSCDGRPRGGGSSS